MAVAITAANTAALESWIAVRYCRFLAARTEIIACLVIQACAWPVLICLGQNTPMQNLHEAEAILLVGDLLPRHHSLEFSFHRWPTMFNHFFVDDLFAVFPFFLVLKELL